MGLPRGEVTFYSNLAPAPVHPAVLPAFGQRAGQLAEKYDKARITCYVKLFEIAAMALAAWGFHTHDATCCWSCCS